MEKIKRNKITVTIGLFMIVALLAGLLLAVLNANDGETLAYEINEGAINAVIGDHGVGEAEHLVQGQEEAVRNRFNVGSDYQVVWISTSDELRTHLESATAAASNAGANKIIVFTNDITWNQTSIADDVGTQKFTGILDGNGYALNIVFSATLNSSTKGKKGDNSAYYFVSQSDLGESNNNFSGTDGNGVRGMGLVVGVNAGTIANMTINYSAVDGAMRDGGTVNSEGRIEDTNSLDSAENPDVPYGYGIVTGVNIGTIQNVYVNQQSIFNGNTKARTDFNGSSHANPAEAHENCASVGGITGINMGYGIITGCYMYVGADIWAQADGSSSNGTDSAARYAATFAGGIAGWIRGDNCQITYCYLDGNGGINSWAQRGKNLTLGGQREPWSISYAGGITSGKIQLYRESNYTLGVERRNCYSVAQPMGANQIKGIISNWTGYRRDSYGSDSYVDTTHTFTNTARTRTGMPFDFLYSADQGSDKQDLVIFTYNYKAETGNDTLDLDHYANDGGESTSPAKMNANWTEVYGWGHSLYNAGSEVSVTFEGNYLRVQAESTSFMNGREIQLDTITRSDYPNGYQPKYDSSFMGCMIWETDIYTIASGVNPESSITSTVHKPTDQLGSFVQYYSTSMPKGSYVVKFGATYDYTIQSANTTTRQYNGSDASDMLPTLLLTDAEGTVEVNDSLFNWKFNGAKAGAVEENLTIYPDTYYIQPCAVIDGQENSAYAYYDPSQRTLAVNKGVNSIVIIQNATLSMSYNVTGWTNSASIPVTLTSNGITPSQTIIDAYSYQGGTNSSITELSLSGTNNFTITETATTPRNGRMIYDVKAYVKKADGTYVEVADTTKADVDKKTVTIKIDNAAPVLGTETYYLADQFGNATLDEIKTMINTGNYTALDSAEVQAGRWYDQNVIALVKVSDESRSGISVDTIGVQQLSANGSYGDISEDQYSSVVESGEATIIIKITSARAFRVTASDFSGNSANLDLNNASSINIDTTPITFNDMLEGQTLSVNYSYRSVAGKAFSKLGISFIANFGGAGLSVWYYVDQNSTLENDVTTEPEGANWEWVKYDFSTSMVSGSEAIMLLPVSMQDAAVFVKFRSDTDGYEVADPVVMRVVSDSYYKFNVDLNGANIEINAQYITVNKASTGESYNLAQLVNGQIDGVTLAEFFSKTYDGTNGIGKYSGDGISYADDITFAFTVPADEQPAKKSNNGTWDDAFYSGTFYANTEETNFRTTWLEFVGEYKTADSGDAVNSGACYFDLSLTTSDVSPIDMSISIYYGGDTGTQSTLAVATEIKRINMAFDINQIFSEGADITMSNGSYTLSGTNVTFNWVYGDPFDGLIVTINNDESGGTMSFRFKSSGKSSETYMNVGGSYSAYVDAIKIDSPVYQMEDFAQLVNSDGTYNGDAGLNYTVAISGEIPIKVTAREVRLTFALDGLTRYSFSIPYDTDEHVITASYTDVDGNVQYAKITWKNSSGAATTLTSIKEIGSYTAVASLTDGNYTIKGQYQQTISIQATYLDILVPDKTVQYNDGSAVTYIPDLPENSPIAGKTVVYTITYYKKLDNSIQLLGTDVAITEVGEYYVSVTFDPERQTDPDLQKFARKEYTKGTGSGLDSYISFTVVKADTVITGVESSQTKVYNGSAQIVGYSDFAVKSQSSSKTVDKASVTLQYWDADAQAYVNFDASSNNGKYADVGEYTYRLVYEGNENYNGATLDLTMTINPAEITGVVFGSAIDGETVLGISQVYNGKEVTLVASLSDSSNVKNDPQLKIEYRRLALGAYSTDAPSYVNVGRNQVWLRVSCGDNYLPYETSAYVIITVAQAPDNAITFDAANPGGIMLEEIEYDGKEHSIKYTVNEGNFAEGEILSVNANAVSATDVGEYNGSIEIMFRNYQSYYHETSFTIVPKKITTVDTSSITQVQEEEGLTSDTNLYKLSVTFEDIDGETVEVSLTFWDESGKIVFPDSFGRLPAGTYKVTYDAGDNYDFSAVDGKTLTLEQGTGEITCDHIDENGDGVCDICGTKLEDVDDTCDHVDSDNDGKCDKCGASMGGATAPKETPDIAKYIVIGVCAVLIVAAIAGVIVAAVIKSKKKNNNRYNII